MFTTNAVFTHKNNDFEPKDCAIEKVIRLSGAEYDRFARNMMRDWDFIRDNVKLMGKDSEGRRRCLLIVGDGRRDGILVESQGYDYARYAAFVPNVDGLLTVGRYPALAELNKKLTEIVDTIAERTGKGNPDGRGVVYFDNINSLTGIDLMSNGTLRHVVLDMLGQRSEIADWELDKNELIIQRATEDEPRVENLTDMTVSKTDMYAYGYGFDGMIPFGRDRALELFDKGYGVYLLYSDDTEGAANSRAEIENFDGLFGIEDPEWEMTPQRAPFEVFIVNRESQEAAATAGEWLALPADPEALAGLLERICVGSEGGFIVTAVRVRDETLLGHVSKYDSVDELNVLASFIDDMKGFEFEKLQAMLTSNAIAIGEGLSPIINFIHRELLPEYNGTVPDEYRLVSAAIKSLRSRSIGRDGDKPSVLNQIKSSRGNHPPRQTGKSPKGKEMSEI